MANQVPWTEIITTIIDTLKPSKGKFNLLGFECFYQSSKRISKLQLKYDGKAWCPEWGEIEGKSCTKSELGSIKHAAKDLLEKALSKGYITEEQARQRIEVNIKRRMRKKPNGTLNNPYFQQNFDLKNDCSDENYSDLI